MSYAIFQDWKANKGNIKGQLVMLLYRIAHLARINKIVFILLIPYLIVYKVLVIWVLGVEIPYGVQIGKGLKLYHGQSLVINKKVVIGDHCTLRHSITIGNKQNADGTDSLCPVIGDHVDIGAHVCILGPIRVGNHVKIGAGTIIVKDVPAGSVAIGSTTRIIQRATSEPLSIEPVKIATA